MTRSQRKRQAKAARSSQSSSQPPSRAENDHGIETRASRRGSRVAQAVVVEPSGTPDGVVPARTADSDEENLMVTPSRSRAKAEVTATNERPKLTPKSILGRLHDILGDLKGMVLGKTEHREIDDMLFEIRNEVHAAARRAEEE